MSSVLRYLDCGCAILKDGSRAWCPTCSTPLYEVAERDPDGWTEAEREADARRLLEEDR